MINVVTPVVSLVFFIQKVGYQTRIWCIFLFVFKWSNIFTILERISQFLTVCLVFSPYRKVLLPCMWLPSTEAWMWPNYCWSVTLPRIRLERFSSLILITTIRHLSYLVYIRFTRLLTADMFRRNTSAFIRVVTRWCVTWIMIADVTDCTTKLEVNYRNYEQFWIKSFGICAIWINYSIH